MIESLQTPCQRGGCNYFGLERLDEPTKEYIFENCRSTREAFMRNNPDFGPDQCPFGTVTASVIMKVEGEDEMNSWETEL